jgi:hypothetical protein
VEAVKVVVICLHTGTCLLVGPVLRLSSNPMCDGEGVLRISYTAMGGRVVIWSQDLRRPANQSLLPSDSSLHGNLSAIHGPWRCICYLKSADVVQMLWRCSEQRKGTPHGKEQYVSGASMSSSNSQDTTHRIASQLDLYASETCAAAFISRWLREGATLKRANHGRARAISTAGRASRRGGY